MAKDKNKQEKEEQESKAPEAPAVEASEADGSGLVKAADAPKEMGADGLKPHLKKAKAEALENSKRHQAKKQVAKKS